MAYLVNRSNGTALAIINDGTLNTSTSLGLIGRNYTGYGEIQNENFVFLLENFSNENPPARPISGQAWFDSVNKKLNVYNGEVWIPVGSATVSTSEPPPITGSFWIRQDSQQLYVYSTQGWTLIGPEATLGFGKTRMESRIVMDVDGINRPIICSLVDDKVITIISDQNFTIPSTGDYLDFFNIVRGINMNNSVVKSTDSVLTREILILFDNNNSSLNNKILFNLANNEYGSTDKQINLRYSVGTNQWTLSYLAGNGIDVIYAGNTNNDPTLITQWFTDSLFSSTVNGPTISRQTSSTTVSKLINQFNFSGNLKGNAETATRFETARTINGVIFDGQNDITIGSNTNNNLIRGDYLIGNNFNGSAPTTWSVDASSSNILGKVVVRDSSGDFAAGKITADEFIGLHKGNVEVEAGISIFDKIVCNSIDGAEFAGNAATSGRLSPGRRINTVLFDGSQDITVPASAETLTGNRISSSVLESSLNVVGVLNSLSVQDAGVTVGATNQLSISVVNSAPTVADLNGQGLVLATRDENQPQNLARIKFINSATSLSIGGSNGPSLIPEYTNKTNLGSPSYIFSNIYTSILHGTATTAKYADLAENYQADSNYEIGTVLDFGGEKEVTISANDASNRVAGIVSENPAYLMNSELRGDNVVALALIGRVKCKIHGPVKKGDMLVSAGNGAARAESNPRLGTVIARSLQDFLENYGMVEVAVGKL